MQPIFVLRWSEGASSWIYKAEIRRDKELCVNNVAKAKRSTKTYPGRRELKGQYSWHQHVFYYFSTALNVMAVFVILRHTRWKSCSYNGLPFFKNLRELAICSPCITTHVQSGQGTSRQSLHTGYIWMNSGCLDQSARGKDSKGNCSFRIFICLKTYFIPTQNWFRPKSSLLFQHLTNFACAPTSKRVFISAWFVVVV